MHRHQLTCLLHAAVQINRRQNGLHRVRQHARLLPTAGLLLALVHAQGMPYAQLARHLCQSGLAHQQRPLVRQAALLLRRMRLEQQVAHDVLQHRVP